MLIILRLAVLPHKHPHELLDSVVKERFDQVFRLNRGRASYSSLVSRQAVFEEVFLSSQPLTLPINLASLVSGRRIIQRSNPLSTTPFNRLRST